MGPAAQQAFNAASTLTKSGHGFIENTLSKIIKGDQINPEAAATAALGGSRSGGSTSRRCVGNPQGADELAAYKLRAMGEATPGTQSAELNRLSPGGFLTERAKLAPEAAAELWGSDPRVLALSRVGESMRNTNQFLNTSNSGLFNALNAVPAGLGAAGGALLSGQPGAALGLALGAATPWVGSYGLGRAVSSPMITGLLGATPATAAQGAPYTGAALLSPAIRGLLGGLGP